MESTLRPLKAFNDIGGWDNSVNHPPIFLVDKCYIDAIISI